MNINLKFLDNILPLNPKRTCKIIEDNINYTYREIYK